MREPTRPYQGKRRGTRLSILGGLVLLLSALAYLLAPFSVRKFAAFPALGGVFLALFGLTYRAPRAGRALRGVLAGLLALCVVGFGALEAVIIAGARTEIAGDPQIMLVLGAQVHPWGPSVLLADRLDAALGYLEDHPDILVVVSGGQGPDEPATEASVMRDYLTARGVDPARILLEEESHNTYQNLQYTYQLLRDQGHEARMDQVLVVTNGFHLARVRMLWPRVWGGSDALSTLAAPETHATARLQSYIREAPALVKSFLLDR